MTESKCKICKKTNSETKLTYNTTQEDFICLDCYRNQFPSIPIHYSELFLLLNYPF
jgi:hypothetical protein